MPDWIRLGIGTLTRLPVPAPRDTGRRTAGLAISAAPIIGAVLALVCGLPLLLPTEGPAGFVAAVLVIALLAWATRALHLDGLADTADALGSGRSGPAALEIARKSDIGPFGVVSLLFTLLLQAGSLAACASRGDGYAALLVAVVTSRVALTWACGRGVPAARPDGLGAAVAGTVPRIICAAWVIIATVAAYAVLGAAGASSVVVAIASAVIVLIVARRRLGGVTGDVLGAVIEVAATCALVVLALCS
jgi:adenosylcobinamide-GDP ribazoletransferase